MEFVLAKTPDLVAAHLDVEDGDLNLRLDNVLVAYIKPTGTMFRLRLHPNDIRKLADKGIRLDESGRYIAMFPEKSISAEEAIRLREAS